MNRCSRALPILALLLACLAAGPVRAAGDSFSALADKARSCGVSGETVNGLASQVAQGLIGGDQAGALLAPLLAACGERLPLAPLEDKLAEGLAKRVPVELILPVLTRRLDAFRQARLMLEGAPGDSPEALLALGEGLDLSVPASSFEAYLSEFRPLTGDRFLTGLSMVAYQGQAQFDNALTLDMIRQGVASDSLAPGWRYFVRIILAARRRGLDDAAVARAAVETLREGGAVTGVVTRLGFTGRSLSGQPEQ